MRILLDTHVFLWCLTDDKQLSKEARKRILDATEVFVSSASIWEAAIKIKIKKLDADINELANAILENGFLELPIYVKHTSFSCTLPLYHRDPFDRILLAQAMSEPLRFLTADARLKKYSELVDLI